MRHGNVYPPDRAALALERFFTEPNLTALRDLSLRFVAGKVDEQLEGIVSERGLHVGPVTERVMVLVDESAECRRAVRRSASIASALHAPLLGVAVETPGVRLSRDRQQNIQANVDYATDLGAEIIRGEASDLARGLEEVVRERRITTWSSSIARIVACTSAEPRSPIDSSMPSRAWKSTSSASPRGRAAAPALTARRGADPWIR